MSEYQHYEWQAIDRALNGNEVKEVGCLSSHMDLVTPTQAIVTYNWGDFKHDPVEVMLRYFDAMYYWANWGSRALAFRFPKGTIDLERVRAYRVDGWLTLREEGDYHLLDLDMLDQEPGDWDVGPDGLGPLVPLRQQIIEGDYRALYLAWLRAAEEGENILEEDPEPPVPAGLKELNASLEALAHSFLEINPFLLEVAAAASDPLQPVPNEALAASLGQLAPDECRAYLLRVLKNEPQMRSSLKKRLAEMAGIEVSPPKGQRTAGELLEEAECLGQEEHRRRQEAAKRKRRQGLEDLARREDSVWRQVEDLIDRKQPTAYEQAVTLLKQLRELAEYQGRLPEFEGRVAEIRSRYGRRTALMARLDKAGL
jgi:hypothetical protein